MKNASFSVDVEKDLHSQGYLGVTRGLKRLAIVLDKNNIKATFFVTGEVLSKYPGIFKALKNKRHEIALHGYSHRRFDSLNSGEKKEEINKSVNIYRKVFGISPRGFRAPQHSIDKETLMLLDKNKFLYDSSVCSKNLMLLRHIFKMDSNKIEIIRNFFGKSHPYKVSESLTEIPRSSPLLALGGFELKVYPNWLINCILFKHRIINIPLNFVMHSWDMIDTPGSRTSEIMKAKEFENVLDTFIKKVKLNYKFVRMGELI